MKKNYEIKELLKLEKTVFGFGLKVIDGNGKATKTLNLNESQFKKLLKIF